MPRALSDTQSRLTLVLKTGYLERLQRLATENSTSVNALIVGVMTGAGDQQLLDIYNHAVEQGLVRPQKRDGSQVVTKLRQAAQKLPPTDLARALELLKKEKSNGSAA